ncbi:SUMO ligase siz1 [Pseudocyphellaria aurata]|nr:SUMO ligase siz1 [Pseudocyphellaria aurata]
MTAKVKTLINAQLKSVLKKEGLAVSGVKATMQERIIHQIEQYVRSRNIERYINLRTLINNPDGSHLNSSAGPPSFQSSKPSRPNQQQFALANGVARPVVSLAAAMHSQSYGTPRPSFKDSPFYTILEPLTPVMECKVREATRDQLDVKIALKNETADKLVKDSSIKAMVYCASDPISPYSKAEISFPYQIEIKVNQDEVKANLRGLKNKPGSTRPADITNLLRKRAGYENSMTVIYALTTKKFHLIVNLVRQHAAEELVTKLRSGKTISINQVVREMVSKGKDNDIVATSSIMSLKCPLSTLRINVPCRSTVCTHNQCFDALSFLQLQEQAPTWQCPICSKSVSFAALEVDEYVSDILAKTPKDIDQVTIEPSGIWSQTSELDASLKRNGDQMSCGDDDDLVELKDMPRIAAVKNELTHLPGTVARTSPGSSREQSAASTVAPSGNGKRSHGQVIEISSDDENDEYDDEPLRGPKRQITHSSGLSSFSNSKFLSPSNFVHRDYTNAP